MFLVFYRRTHVKGKYAPQNPGMGNAQNLPRFVKNEFT